MRNILLKIIRSILLLVVFITASVSFAKATDDVVDEVHELTFYVIPSTEALDWATPGSLFDSYYKSYLRNVLVCDKYLMGHLFIGLSTPLIEDPYMIGISSASKREQRNLLLRDKIGFAILKIDMQGKIESTKHLQRKLKRFNRRDEISQITFRVSKPGMERVIAFIERFKSKFNDKQSPADFYGGDFYPRFYHEGSGCTALGMAMLELCGIPLNIYQNWLVSVKIPMEIIGGKFNQGNEVSIKDLKKVDSWADSTGKENIDYIVHTIYDPSIIYEWVADQLKLPAEERDSGYVQHTVNGVAGLFIDKSHIEPLVDDPIFYPRYTPSIFIENYLRKIGVPLEN